VQVEPIKPTLKAPETWRLKLKCHEPLSNFALNFSLRRYTKVRALGQLLARGADVLMSDVDVVWMAGAYTRPLLSST